MAPSRASRVVEQGGLAADPRVAALGAQGDVRGCEVIRDAGRVEGQDPLGERSLPVDLHDPARRQRRAVRVDDWGCHALLLLGMVAATVANAAGGEGGAGARPSRAPAHGARELSGAGRPARYR
jgi:hypothetical protein